MLLQFSVTNYRSFREKAVLSFVSSAQKDEPDLRFASKHADHGVLPVIGLWGPNASGKSNLIKALREMQRIVRDSFRQMAPTDSLPFTPWRLDKTGPPTRFELDFLLDDGEHDDVRVCYGFSVDAQGVRAEWLHQWVEGRRMRVIFERDHDQDEPWRLGSTFRGQRKQLIEATRRNSLLLSVGAQNNNAQLLDVYNEIVSGVEWETPAEPLFSFSVFDDDALILSDQFRPALVDLLRQADLGIVDVRVEEFQVNQFGRMIAGAMRSKGAPDDASATIEDEFLRLLDGQDEPESKLAQILLVHGHPTEPVNQWTLSPESESLGTLTLLTRIQDIFSALHYGDILFIDEIETSLHPDICAAIVSLFTSRASNPRRAQLVFTSHNRALIEGLRRDQIWFVAKDRSGTSSIFSAADFDDIRARDNVRRAYRDGRMGAVPVLGDIVDAVRRGLDET